MLHYFLFFHHHLFFLHHHFLLLTMMLPLAVGGDDEDGLHNDINFKGEVEVGLGAMEPKDDLVVGLIGFYGGV